MKPTISNVETSEVTEHTAHNILNYCITNAVLKNKNHNFKVQLPYATIAKSAGMSQSKIDEYAGVALELTVKLEWVEHETDDVELTYE